MIRPAPGTSAASAAEGARDLRERGADVVDVSLGHAGEQRQRDGARVRVLGGRELLRLRVQAVAEVRMPVDRNEVHGRPDVLRAQLVDEARPVDRERVEIEGDYNVRGNIKTVVRASYTRPD